MSSTYLTSRDMNILEQLLAEVREPAENRSFDKETAQARMLVRAIERGIHSSSELRVLLAKHVRTHQILDHSSQRWENEGGAIHS